MNEFEFDFSWPVAERYEIRPIEDQGARPKREYGKPRRNRAVDTIAAAKPEVPFEIVAQGPVTLRCPLENSELWRFLLETYRRFEAAGEPHVLQMTVLRFAKQYGLLQCKSEDGQVERLDDWHFLIEDLRALRARFQLGTWELGKDQLVVERMSAALVSDPLTGAPRLTFRPHSLRGAIQLQLAHKLARGAQLKACVQCGANFEAGINGKRGDAKFCSDACRYIFNNKKKQARRAKDNL